MTPIKSNLAVRLAQQRLTYQHLIQACEPTGLIHFKGRVDVDMLYHRHLRALIIQQQQSHEYRDLLCNIIVKKRNNCSDYQCQTLDLLLGLILSEFSFNLLYDMF